MDAKFNAADVCCFFVAAAIGAGYLSTKHWILNNVFGMAFAINGVSLLQLGSFAIGATLLSGLFFYDVFWVFGTDVMVTVAKSFDAPIKGTPGPSWQRHIARCHSEPGEQDFPTHVPAVTA